VNIEIFSNALLAVSGLLVVGILSYFRWHSSSTQSLPLTPANVALVCAVALALFGLNKLIGRAIRGSSDSMIAGDDERRSV
jgi:hypothetical protein